MNCMPDFAEEKEYTAKVQRMLLAIIDSAETLSGSHLDSIRAIIADAWEELRLRPTELSVQEMEQLSAEVDRFAARRDFALGQAERYRKMLMDPFFARVDFREDGEDRTERIVIGLYSLHDEQGELMVHDWRAPICSLYYDGEPGRAGYDCPDGRIMGSLELKRQYKMKNGQLQYYVDTQLSIEDDMLLELLSEDSGRHMKQIAATIQQEQNAIIRSENAKVVCVVGGAGSGKTSVALHRAAYMMYHCRETLDANHIMIVSPSTAFSEYISDVLPNLGEDNIQSTTMNEIVNSVLNRKVDTLTSQMEHLLVGNETLRNQSVRYKSDYDFLQKLITACEVFKAMGPQFMNVRSDDRVLIHRDELRRMYQNELKVLSPAQRVERMRLSLNSRIDSWAERLSRKYEQMYAEKYTGKALTTAVQLAVTRQLQPVRAQMKRCTDVTGDSLMAEVMRQAPAVLKKAFYENRDAGIVWWEDAAAEVFMLLRLGFAPVNKHIYHVLVDEAQDYSETELAILHELYPNAHVTVLGDPRQRTCPALPECLPENWSKCFGEEAAPTYQLMNCYRSTRQIADFCNRILPPTDQPMIPYGRDGEAVTVARFSVDALKAQLAHMREKGYQSIAVLTRTHQAAEQLSEHLDHVYRLDGGEDDLNYEAADNVVAAYHRVKGMEFDAVIIVWPDTELTADERHRLYTACTRALHRASVLTDGALLAALEEKA